MDHLDLEDRLLEDPLVDHLDLEDVGHAFVHQAIELLVEVLLGHLEVQVLSFLENLVPLAGQGL